jgi:hypothetical protein
MAAMMVMVRLATETAGVRWRAVERAVRFLAGIAILAWAAHDLAMR